MIKTMTCTCGAKLSRDGPEFQCRNCAKIFDASGEETLSAFGQLEAHLAVRDRNGNVINKGRDDGQNG